MIIYLMYCPLKTVFSAVIEISLSLSLPLARSLARAKFSSKKCK